MAFRSRGRRKEGEGRREEGVAYHLRVYQIVDSLLRLIIEKYQKIFQFSPKINMLLDILELPHHPLVRSHSISSLPISKTLYFYVTSIDARAFDVIIDEDGSISFD